jgi:hypothetical protein
MSKFRTFLSHRYGQDALNVTCLLSSLLLTMLSLVFRTIGLLFALPSIILSTIVIIRFFSKNKIKRKAENEAFLVFITPITRQIKLISSNFKDRHRKYFLCPMCKKMVRIPRRKGKVEITCPTCHHHFKARS